MSKFFGSRKKANSVGGEHYLVPLKFPFGIAYSGVLDKDKQLLPIEIKANPSEEKHQIEEGSDVRPAKINMVLDVTVSKMKPDVTYNLYRYTDEKKVPIDKFNKNSKNRAASV